MNLPGDKTFRMLAGLVTAFDSLDENSSKNFPSPNTNTTGTRA
jgi:hypothetical protein